MMSRPSLKGSQQPRFNKVDKPTATVQQEGKMSQQKIKILKDQKVKIPQKVKKAKILKAPKGGFLNLWICLSMMDYK